jgi:hypothetical protein
MSQNRGHQRAYCSYTGWYLSMESHGDDAGWGKHLTRPPELSGSPTSRDICVRVGGMDEGVRILRVSIFELSQRNFNFPQNLTTWGLRLCHPK